MDHSAHKAAFENAMSDRAPDHKIEYNSGEDKAVYPSTPDRLRYSESNSDNDDRMTVKSPTDNSRMPIAKSDIS
jgi:hypothetical protein